MNAGLRNDFRFFFSGERHGFLYLLLCQDKQGKRSIRIIVQPRKSFKPRLLFSVPQTSPPHPQKREMGGAATRAFLLIFYLQE
jgi:hypothetical protein